jgi:hypothetical protein
MKGSLRYCSVGLFTTLASFSACGVDDRGLSYEYRGLDAAGSLPSAGDAGAAGDADAAPSPQGASGNSAGGDAGVPGAGNSASGRNHPEQAGAAASEQGGTTTGDAAGNGGGAGNGGPTVSNGGAAGSTTPGSAGHAGSELPCGDLNQDAVDDCSQTLVQNSRFDSAFNGWEAEPLLSQAWDSSNATDKPGSGSLLLTNTAATIQEVGSATIGSHQCVPAIPAATYDVAARVMLAAGEPAGEAGVNIWFFDDEQCQGNIVSGNTPISGGVAGKWTVLQGRLWIPGGVHSMYVRLVAIKPFVQPSLKVLVDDVLVAKR